MMVVINISEEYYFRLHDGRVIKSLVELRDLLRTMNQSLYDYHVTVDRNDFATWIHDVLQDTVLSNQMQQAISPKEMGAIIDAKLADDASEIQRLNREKIRTAKFIFPLRNARKKIIDEMKRIYA